MANENRGPQFERQVLKTLRAMEITCYGSHGQIPQRELYPNSSSDDHIEIDIVGLVGNICLLIEVTTLGSRNRDKIQRFIRHCDLIANCPLSSRQLFSKFQGIPEEELNRFTGISDWRYVYIGTSPKLVVQNISPRRYPETDCLRIFNAENWEYFKALERAIKSTSKYEFLAALDINPSDLRDPVLGNDLPPKNCLELANTILYSGQVRASLIVAVFTPDELLRVARVLRYQGQPMMLATSSPASTKDSTSEGGSGYQRILNRDKLRKISDFVDNNSEITFPTNLTLVLSKECEVQDGKLHVPGKYASIDVIDGQHRLFSYALADKEIQRDSRLIATAIKFHTDDAQEITRCAAQIFSTINREQTKVKKDLLYLISYDLLGDQGSEAIAAKILKECDSKPNGILSGIFELRAFVKKNRFGQQPIPIVSIVGELARISKQEKLYAIRFALGNQVATDLEESEALIQAGGALLERYFSEVKEVFQDDWGNEDSLLMCAKYVGAFIRLLETFLSEELTVDRMDEELRKIKQNLLQKYSEGRSSESNPVFNPEAFHSFVKEDGEPSTVYLLSKKEASLGKVHKILNEIRTYRPPTVD